MVQKSESVSPKKYLLAAILLWVVLWVVPWGGFSTTHLSVDLAFIIDLTRLGLALLLFIVPGALLYILIERKVEHTTNLLGVMAIGFSFSIFLISVVGLLGRLVGFSFGLVRNVFVLFGAIEIILVACSNHPVVLPNIPSWRTLRSWFHNPPLVFALIIVFLYTLNDDLFFLDDATYGAYVTNWQFSEQLGFRNIIHHLDALELSRFWLAMYPMGQALLSNLSGVPGLLLLSNYLEPLLTPMAVPVLYWFARKLGLSKRVAGFSVLVQASLYVWMVGEEWPVGKWFFESLSEDKVATVFFLAPVFFITELWFIQDMTWRSRILFILSGLAIVLTHPVMLFFSCSIAAGFAILAWIAKKSNFYRLLEICVICIILMIPYATIRFSDNTGETAGPYDGDQARTTFQIERYANIIDDRFYGLNPQVLMFTDLSPEGKVILANQIFRTIPIVILALGAILANSRIKQGPVHWYILSSSLLVFIGTLPYTGWILGYFVSTRMLSRVSWFAPYGLAAVIVVQAVINWRKSRSVLSAQQLSSTLEKRGVMLGMMFSFLFVGPILLISLTERMPKFFQHLEHNRQLAELGAYIDQNTQTYTTVIATDYTDLQLLPAASARASLISYREEIEYNGFNNSLPINIVRERIVESTAIRSIDPSIKKCFLMEKYSVKFILVQVKDESQFEETLLPCDVPIEKVKRTKDFVLLKIP